MALKKQSVDGHITANGIRLVRQAIVTGETVCKADVLATIAYAIDTERQLHDLRAAADVPPAGLADRVLDRLTEEGLR